MRNVSYDEFIAAAKAVCTTRPDRTNPREGVKNIGRCVYLKAGKHCLLGEILLTKFHLTYEKWWEGHNAAPIMRQAHSVRFTEEALSAARRLQQIADGMTPASVLWDKQRTWGEAWDIYVEHFPNGVLT